MTELRNLPSGSSTSIALEANLLAIVAVDQSDQVRCGQPGCGHSVYRRIHVVREGPELLVLGSTCFGKRYGFADALGSATYGSGNGRQLTPEERQLLVENTALLLARFEEEERAEVVRQALSAPAISQPVRAPRPGSMPVRSVTPWEWMKPMTSMAYFRLRDGTSWVRVQRKDGRQLLVPWPSFEGWDEALPGHIGAVDTVCGGYLLTDVVAAIRYMRELTAWERITGVWREIVALAAR